MKCLLLALILPVALTSTSSPGANDDPPLQLELADLREIRTLVVAEADDDADDFGMMDDGPGLYLSFRLKTSNEYRVLEVRQPTRVDAVDSVGTDISDIEEGFSGEKEYTSVGMTFGDDPPTDMTFHLGMPARAAESFSLSTTFDAVVFADTEEHTFEVGNEWIEIAEGTLGDQRVKLKFGKNSGMFGDTIGLTVVPSSARDAIESVKVEFDGEEYESNMSMWSDKEITYGFDDGIPENAAVMLTLTVRTGVQIVPVNIELKDQKLP